MPKNKKTLPYHERKVYEFGITYSDEYLAIVFNNGKSIQLDVDEGGDSYFLAKEGSKWIADDHFRNNWDKGFVDEVLVYLNKNEPPNCG